MSEATTEKLKQLLKECINPLSQCGCPTAKNLAHKIRDELNIQTSVWERLPNSCSPNYDDPKNTREGQIRRIMQCLEETCLK